MIGFSSNTIEHVPLAEQLRQWSAKPFRRVRFQHGFHFTEHKCPHDLCGFKVGRLTPWNFKALMSAKKSRFKREIPAPLSGLLALSSPHPRPQSVRVRSQSATTTAVCPWPRTIHVRDLSANMSVSSQRTDRDRDLSVAVSGRCASRGRELTGPRPSNSL